MSDRRVLSLTVLLGSVFFLFFLYFVFSLPSKRAEVSDSVSRRDRLEKKYDQLSSLLSVKGALSESRGFLLEALPQEEAVPTLMTQIEGLGKLSGVSVSHLGFSLPQKEDGSKGLKEVLLTVVATGSQASLQTFLTNVEKTSRVIFVNSLRFSQAVEKSGAGEVTSNLGVSAFYFPETGGLALDRLISLDMTSKTFTELLARVKSLRVYQPPAEEPSVVGKENLFEE